VYEVGAGLTLVVGLVTALLLPREPRRDPLPYHRLLGSMVRLARTKPQVRRAILVQLPIFATFNLVWVPLVFLLTGPDYGYSVAKAGLMGLLSMATVLTAPPAGRLLERRGPRGIMVAGFPLLAAGSLAMLWSTKSIVVVIAGVVLLVVGQQFIQLGNQSRVLNSTTRERSRVNTLFMTSNFLGASAASATAGYVYAHAGWLGVMVCAVAFSLAAVAIWGVTEWRTVAEERAAN
jgi:predicted MFS family arabinose efflux permease